MTVIRHNKDLKDVTGKLDEMSKRWNDIDVLDTGPMMNQAVPFVNQLWNMLELAKVIAHGALARNESRGAHRLRDTARDHGFEAAQLALRSADPQWEITVLLRISDLFDRLGDHDDAIALQCRAVELMTHASCSTVEPAAPAPRPA